MFNLILILYQNQQYQKLINHVNNKEEDVRILELKGLSAIKIKSYKLSYEIFKTLVKIDNKDANYFHLGLSCMEIGRFKKASKAFKKCLNNNQFGTPSALNRANCLIQMKEDKRALKILNQYCRDFPEIKGSWTILLKYYRTNKYVEQLDYTLELSKKYIDRTLEWKTSKAYLIYFQNNYKQVIDYIESEKLIEYLNIKKLIAKCYSKISEFEKSVDVYKNILKNELNCLNYYNLAAAYSNLTSNSDLTKAIEYADLCLLEDSEYHQAYYCKALVYQKTGYNSKALEMVELALNIDNRNVDYLVTKAELLDCENQHDKSLAVINDIFKIDESNNRALRLKGIIELKNNKLELSEIDLLKAIDLDKTDQRAIAYYSIAKLAQHKSEEVSEFLGLGTFVKEYILNPQPEYLDLEAFNRDFESDIKNHSLLRKEPKGLAARNGYLTDNIFQDKTKSITLFKKILLEKIEEYIKQLPVDLNHHMLRHKTADYKISSWATWVKGDGFIDKHIHEESWISGAYYCKIPKVTENTVNKQGYFEYGCIPNDIKIPIEKERGYIKPVEGKLVIFPSYLYHQTIPHKTDEDRISIAFDLTPLSWKK